MTSDKLRSTMEYTKTRSYLLLFIFYFTAHFPILFLYNARYWDDWSLFNATQITLIDTFSSAGLPLIGYLHFGIQKLGWWSYSTLIFVAFYLITLCSYKILKKLNASTFTAFWISVLIGVIPVNFARVTAITLPYSLSMAFFMASWLALLSLKGKYQLLLRLVSLIGFFLSFQMGSLLVFYVLPISSCFFVAFTARSAMIFKNFVGLSLKHIDFIILPLIFFLLKSNYFKPYGIFDNYNSPSISLDVLVRSFSPVADFFTAEKIGLTTSSISIILLCLIVIFPHISKFLPSVERLKPIRIDMLMIAGLVVIFLGCFPYAAVDRLPSPLDWTSSRHQALLMFGLSIIIFFILIIYIKIIGGNIQKISKLIPLIFTLLFTINWWQIYSEFYVDNLKQNALILLLKDTPKIQNNNIFILDNTKFSYFNSGGFGEYAGIYADTFGRDDSLIFDYNILNYYSGTKHQFIAAHSKWFGNWSKTENVNPEIKPSLYILNQNIQVKNNVFFSMQMVINKIFFKDTYYDILRGMLTFDGPIQLPD